MKDAVDTLIDTVCDTEQERNYVSQRCARLSQNQRTLFNFILTDEQLYDEWLTLSYQDDTQGLTAFLYRAREEVHKKSATVVSATVAG